MIRKLKNYCLDKTKSSGKFALASGICASRLSSKALRRLTNLDNREMVVELYSEFLYQCGKFWFSQKVDKESQEKYEDIREFDQMKVSYCY